MIYLYLKIHSKTGLRYLGKTSKINYSAYLGSGKIWLQHLRKYGKEHTTILIKECKSQQELSYWGRYYSKLWRVTSAMDDFGNLIYANIIPETGGGALYGDLNPSRRPEVQNAKRDKMLGTKRPETANAISKSWSDTRKQQQKEKTSGKNHYTHRKNKLGKNHPLYGTKRPGTGLPGDKNPAKRPDVREKMRGKRGNNLLISGKNHYTKQEGYISKISGNDHYSKQENFIIKPSNKNFDHNLYLWENIETGESVVMNRRDFIKQFNLRPSDICELIKGARKKTKGWQLKKVYSNLVEF